MARAFDPDTFHRRYNSATQKLVTQTKSTMYYDDDNAFAADDDDEWGDFGDQPADGSLTAYDDTRSGKSIAAVASAPDNANDNVFAADDDEWGEFGEVPSTNDGGDTNASVSPINKKEVGSQHNVAADDANEWVDSSFAHDSGDININESIVQITNKRSRSIVSAGDANDNAFAEDNENEWGEFGDVSSTNNGVETSVSELVIQKKGSQNNVNDAKGNVIATENKDEWGDFGDSPSASVDVHKAGSKNCDVDRIDNAFAADNDDEWSEFGDTKPSIANVGSGTSILDDQAETQPIMREQDPFNPVLGREDMNGNCVSKPQGMNSDGNWGDFKDNSQTKPHDDGIKLGEKSTFSNDEEVNECRTSLCGIKSTVIENHPRGTVSVLPSTNGTDDKSAFKKMGTDIVQMGFAMPKIQPRVNDPFSGLCDTPPVSPNSKIDSVAATNNDDEVVDDDDDDWGDFS